MECMGNQKTVDVTTDENKDQIANSQIGSFRPIGKRIFAFLVTAIWPVRPS